VFSNQASACNEGYDQVRHSHFDFAGFLDADVSFGETYFENLLEKFKVDPRLGMGGGQLWEYQRGGYSPRPGNSESCVAGAVQFFRRQCYEDIGARLLPLRYGGHDAVAVFMARQKGWEVRSFSDLQVLHHRPTGTAGASVWRARLRRGMEDYFIGYHVLFEAGKCIRRALVRPYVLGSLLCFCGYLFPSLTRQKRVVPDDFVRYLRREQMRRVFQETLGRQEDVRNQRDAHERLRMQADRAGAAVRK
jgi:hypothetical protein